MSNGVQRTTIEKLLRISETQDATIIETAFRTEDDKSNIIFKEIDK